MQHTTDAESEPGLPPSAVPLPAIEASRQAVPHAALEEARRQVLEALERGAPLVALIGAAGTGKTLLLGQLAEILRGRQDGVLLLRTPHDLLTYRAEAGDAALAAATVLLDEADRAGDDQLAPLLGIGQAVHLPPRVFIGLPPLLRRLEALGRPAVAVTLGPVSRAELPGFIAARLASAGYAPNLFAAEAVEELARRSGGVPRLVNVLTKAAAFAASLEGSPEVLASHVVEATRHAAGIAPATRAVPPSAPAEPPAPRPRPAEGAPPARPHLVDAAAEWVDGLRPLPPPAPPPAPVAPAAAPPPAEAPASSSLPEVAADAALPAPVAPPLEAVPATPDEIAIPPQPVAEVRPVEPAPGSAEPLATATVPLAASSAPPDRPVPPAVAEPVLAEAAPAVSPARRRRGAGWVLAVVALLILAGAAVAVERSKDAPPGSPLARLAPARAWLAERTDLDRIMAALRSDSGSPPAARTAPAAEAPTSAAITAAPVPAPAPAVAPTPEPVTTPEPVAAPEPPASRPDLSGPPPAASAAPSAPTPAPAEPTPATPPPPTASAAPAAEPSAPEPIPPVPPVNQGFLAPPAPPPPAEAPARAEAPSGPPARVIVHFLSATPQGRSERLLAGLTARYPDLQVRRGGRGPSFAAVRHFLPEDAGSAQAVAALLASAGVEARVQDFSSYRPRPRPGTIEVWLP